MTTLDQMAKAAYEAAWSRYCRRDDVPIQTFDKWEAITEPDREDWREGIRAALAAANDPLAPDELEADVKPDAVTEEVPTECSPSRGHFYNPATNECYCGALIYHGPPGNQEITLRRRGGNAVSE
jgi:hypothetical protein